jgi:hypothetical protein
MARKYTTQAVGHIDSRNGLVKMVCSIDPETFQQIRTKAIEQKTSVAHQIRMLIEWGLEAS